MSQSIVIPPMPIQRKQDIAYHASYVSTPEIRARPEPDSTNSCSEDPGSSQAGVFEPPELTIHNPPKNFHRVIASGIWILLGGFTDGAPGALLPTIETYYDVSYSVVSMIWVSSAVGYLVVALLASTLSRYVGRSRLPSLGVACQMVMFAMISPGAAFPITVVSFFFGGMGFAITLSQLNVFFSRLKGSATYLGYLHASYGVGATLAPLVSKSMINAGVQWHYVYAMLLGVSVLNFFNLGIAFRGAEEDLKPWDGEAIKTGVELDRLSRCTCQGGATTEGVARSGTVGGPSCNMHTPVEIEPASVREPSLMRTALKDKSTWLLSFFLLFYQGGEVAMGGWIVTFLLKSRGGNPKNIAYAAAGFWAGLTLGRMSLTRPVEKFLGGRRGVIVLLVLSIALALLTWVIPHVIVAAVFLSLCGLAIGPVYTLMIAVSSRTFPRKIQVVSLTIVSAFGSSGGAVFPFLVGLISQYVGTYAVLPIFMSLLGACLGCWLLLPNIDRNAKLVWWHYLW
ncbi:hypothetical protein BABINDRAFT_163460 [Babjeviella inositovora NRRL Y-12698]|uniref:Major facilitator superfamily (MFS) profile domain-containing protein n=1 Tax=Babjeviella inositovora NRRL Y-12698 TaxID=984486 RepID=A0A1E3QIK6_9ASCO|nr:uncharacterized protein BABINDRAFT_163460 [Babjeviella inositovora NRRL Y-12698]ODQ77438.1 hypothetical protein BABINDRAFT_163460 [Babjeviella inositovora NRRL Y-12698]